ncbi:hypothetical protein KC19_2G204500 [Ceratodon purpureus]|uniref:Secreted protein n=1 Tax=Ceratodon purpureus TaxID=3225 RepID=A0A8T0IXN8_CERPU|nr:hypothetical protein KC19_2G204500 [Ceratodon purpureus]
MLLCPRTNLVSFCHQVFLSLACFTASFPQRRRTRWRFCCARNYLRVFSKGEWTGVLTKPGFTVEFLRIFSGEGR